MRRWLFLVALIAALSLPLFSPAPASAGEAQFGCPEGTFRVFISEIQFYDPRPGIARAASAADVNHNEMVCLRERGRHGLTFTDDFGFLP